MPTGVCILEATRHASHSRDGLVVLVRERFGVPAYRIEKRLDLDRVYEPSRGQHNATALLQQVLALGAPAGEKVIAVVDVDLFIPVLTFVFGQAQLNGTAAVVSTHRLANEFYGLPGDGIRFRERIHKEVVHELGHLFGLYHCRQFECVMRSSTYVEEIDLKRDDFCEDCAAAVRAGVAGPPGA
jgi:archaemetzincin